MLHPLESFVKKSNHPRPPNPPPASALLKFLGWGGLFRTSWKQVHLAPSPKGSLGHPRTKPQPPLLSAGSHLPQAAATASHPIRGPLGLPQPLAKPTPSPLGKLLPLSQGAPSPPGASEALPLGPALLSHPSPPSPAASLPWGVEGSRDLWNFQGRRGWRPPPAQRQKSRARGRPVCACDLRAQG